MSLYFGFYEKLNELKKEDVGADFDFLRNLNITSETSAYGFLHGCCEEFAAMLSDAFGYEIECVRNANGRNIHTYCVSYINDKKAYIDVRGITTDKALFFEEFENELTYYAPQDVLLVEDDEGYELEAKVETWTDKDELFDGELEGWDAPDIKRFIKELTSFYDVQQYLEFAYRGNGCTYYTFKGEANSNRVSVVEAIDSARNVSTDNFVQNKVRDRDER